MATKNDAMILVLQDKIAKKKGNITNPGKFVPVTTCIFNLYGEKVNILVITSPGIYGFFINSFAC